GHRLGFHAWVNRNEYLRGYRQGTLRDLLTVQERSFSVGQWLGNARAEGSDGVWDGNGRPALGFEVEWMGARTDAVLRGRAKHPGVRRYVVLPRDRVPLVRQRIARNTLLRQTISHDGWTIVDYGQIGALGDGEQGDVDRVARFLGLDGLMTASA